MTGRVRDILHSDKATARQERLISAAYACSNRQIFIRKRRHSIIGLIVIDNTSAVHRSGLLKPLGPSSSTELRISSPARDLADSAILLMLAPIGEHQRRSEYALWLARPQILGALLDVTAHGLHMLPQVRLQRLPRMADFALWATACESAFRRPAGTLETAYSDNRRNAVESIVDADPVAARVLEIMTDRAQYDFAHTDIKPESLSLSVRTATRGRLQSSRSQGKLRHRGFGAG
jgi:hypothetical protein